MGTCCLNPDLISCREFMLVGCARVRTVRGPDLVLKPEIVRLDMGDDRVLGLPLHVTALLSKENHLSDSKAMNVGHNHLRKSPEVFS